MQRRTRVANAKRKIPFLIKLIGIFLAGLIGALFGAYAHVVFQSQYIFLRSGLLFTAGVLSFVLAYGFWRGTKWSWWFGVIMSIGLMLSVFISFNPTVLLIGILLLYGLTERQTRVYFSIMEAQSAIEYLITYSWALILLAVVISIIYFYFLAPSQLAVNSCQFVSGFYCNDVLMISNSITKQTSVTVLLTNTQQYPVTNPQLFVENSGRNTTIVSCYPNYVLAGGAMVCTANVPTQTNLNQLFSGGLYINATYCGASVSPSSQNCGTRGTRQTYSGSFTGHTQTPISTQLSLVISPQNYTQNSSAGFDSVDAVVYFMGKPLDGATVEFSANNPSYQLQRNYSNANGTGTAFSAVKTSGVGTVKITADYGGLTNSIVINFVKLLTITVNQTSNCQQGTAIICISPLYPGVKISGTGSGSGTWANSLIYPIRVAEDSCATGSGNIYCFGGEYLWQVFPTNSYNNGHTLYTNDVFFSPIETGGGVGNWQQTLNYPYSQNVELVNCVSYQSSSIYCLGGQYSIYNGFTEYYSTNSLYLASTSVSGITSWTALTANIYPTMQSPNFGTCNTYSNNIYCVDGYGNIYYTAIFGSGAVGKWQESSNAVPTAFFGGPCVIASSYYYCIGGLAPSFVTGSYGITNSVYYAPILGGGGTGVWQAASNYPTPYGIAFESCVSSPGSPSAIICAGGDGSSGVFPSINAVYSTTLLANGGINGWTQESNLTINVTQQDCVLIAGNIYCVGGIPTPNPPAVGNENIYYSNVTEYAPASSPISSITANTYREWSGNVITLAADKTSPYTGHNFCGWVGSGPGNVTSASNIITLTMIGNVSEVANYNNC